MHCPAWGLQVHSAACQSESHWCVIWNCFLTSLWKVMRCSFAKHLLWKVHLKLELWRKDAFYPFHRWHWVLEQPRGQGGMEKSQGVMATQLFVLAGKNDSFQRAWWKYQIHVSESVQTSKYTKAYTSIFSPWLRRARKNNWNVDQRGLWKTLFRKTLESCAAKKVSEVGLYVVTWKTPGFILNGKKNQTAVISYIWNDSHF